MEGARLARSQWGLGRLGLVLERSQTLRAASAGFSGSWRGRHPRGGSGGSPGSQPLDPERSPKAPLEVPVAVPPAPRPTLGCLSGGLWALPRHHVYLPSTQGLREGGSATRPQSSPCSGLPLGDSGLFLPLVRSLRSPAPAPSGLPPGPAGLISPTGLPLVKPIECQAGTPPLFPPSPGPLSSPHPHMQ